HRAIEQRTRTMFDSGLIEEVHALLAGGCTGDEKPFESLGYRQALEHLRGEISLEQAVESTIVKTRQYAKRQLTWFRADPRIQWIEGFGDEDRITQQSRAIIESFLNNQ